MFRSNISVSISLDFISEGLRHGSFYILDNYILK